MPQDARIGDSLDHGGAIITGASKLVVEGQQTSRVGDIAVCAAHGIVMIVTGASKMVVENASTSRVNDICACGAVIVTGAAKLNIE